MDFESVESKQKLRGTYQMRCQAYEFPAGGATMPEAGDLRPAGEPTPEPDEIRADAAPSPREA